MTQAYQPVARQIFSYAAYACHGRPTACPSGRLFCALPAAYRTSHFVFA